MLRGLDCSPIQISAQHAPTADCYGEEKEPPPGPTAGTWLPEQPAVRGRQLRRLLGCEAWKLKCSSAHHGTRLPRSAMYREEQRSAPRWEPIGYERGGHELGRLNADQRHPPYTSGVSPERMFHSTAPPARPSGICRLAPFQPLDVPTRQARTPAEWARTRSHRP